MKNIKLEIVVFACGAVVMILEMVGSRIMAPYLGTSLFVWTSLIGIILASLSLGYWWGGKLADRRPNYAIFASIIFIAAVVMGLMNALRTPFLIWLQVHVTDLRFGAVISAAILFAVPSVLMGVISPYAARLRMHDVATSGATIGRLYAISTIGSIFGTFFSGFFLISYLGTTKIVYLLVAIMIMTSLLAYSQTWMKTRALMAIAIFLMFPITDHYNEVAKSGGMIDVDTHYSRIFIVDYTDENTGRPVRTLHTSPMGAESTIFLDGNELFAGYQQFYDFAKYLKPDLKTTLMIGAGAYAYPMHFIKTSTDKQTIDTVEIDSDLTSLAKEHFGLKEDPRLNIYHEDGRTFLNRTAKKYDVIFSDAFRTNGSIPYQLVTKEAAKRMYEALNDDGVALINIVSALDGEWSDFLRVEMKTFREVFPQLYLFRIEENVPEKEYQSMILLAIKSPDKFDFAKLSSESDVFVNKLWSAPMDTTLPIFTDDFAPVDKYHNLNMIDSIGS